MTIATLKDKFGSLKEGKAGKKLFFAWIAYQFVKGTLTTTFIWIPLLYIWLQG